MVCRPKDRRRSSFAVVLLLGQPMREIAVIQMPCEEFLSFPYVNAADMDF
jgi:hypothetical protein